MYWICLSIHPSYLQYRGEDKLGCLFREIFGKDYLEHCLLDCEDAHNDPDLDRYVFVHCISYENHATDLQENRYIKNVLNSFQDIVIIPDDEIAEIKTSVNNIIQDDDYCVNRTGFFMFGDIVRVLRGSLSSMNGVIVERDSIDPDFYLVYFRLFVHKFYKKIHISNLEFQTSVFKFVKIPIQRGQGADSTKRIKELMKLYDARLKENTQKRLIDESLIKWYEIDDTINDDLDIADIMLKKKG